MKCQCCGKKIYCRCDSRGFRVGQYVRTTPEYAKTMSGQTIRGKIIHLKDRSNNGDAPLATIKTFFGGKHLLDTSWLCEPYDCSADTFYNKEIEILEARLAAFEDELVPAQREYVKTLEDANQKLKDKIVHMNECPCHHPCECR